MVMDAKALYDALLSEQQNQEDERAALECSMIEEDMELLGCRPRWVPHDKNPADALTKCEGAHFEPMSRLLRTSTFSIREESEELEQRRAVKDVLGYVPRPRSMPSVRQAHQGDFLQFLPADVSQHDGTRAPKGLPVDSPSLTPRGHRGDSM